MQTNDLVDLFRLAVDDNDADDPLWSTLEVYYYMDDAQKQFARGTDYFSDASTVEIVEATITADDPFVTIDPRITKLRNDRLNTVGTKLAPMTYDGMEEQITTPDDYDSPWNRSGGIHWLTSVGKPRFVVTDMETGKYRLAPIPQDSDTLAMGVYRLPLETIVEGVSDFEVLEEDYQRGLLFWMKYLAYQKNDPDTYSERLMSNALLQHESFVKDVKAALRRIRYSSTPGVVRYGGL
jgi:hypothetical protein